MSDTQHLDIYIIKESNVFVNDWIIKLESLPLTNGMISSSGGGYINQPWVLKVKFSSFVFRGIAVSVTLNRPYCFQKGFQRSSSKNP